MAGFYSHFAWNVRVADFSSVLYHFKLVPGLLAQAERAVQRRNYWKRSREYVHYRDLLRRDPDLVIDPSTATRLDNPMQLVRSGFLVGSEALASEALASVPVATAQALATAEANYSSL